MTLKEKVAEIMPEMVREEFFGGVHKCPSSYDFLKGHYGVEVEKCFNEYDCEKCWSQPYIENVDKDTNIPTKNIKVGTKWRDEENDITFFIIEVHGDVVIIEGEIISCSVMSKEHLLKRCKCVDDTDINVGNKNSKKESDKMGRVYQYNGKEFGVLRIAGIKNPCLCKVQGKATEVLAKFVDELIRAYHEYIKTEEEYESDTYADTKTV